MISATSSSSFLGCGSIIVVGSATEYAAGLLRVISQDGFAVKHVYSGSEAMEHVRAEWLDAMIVLDDGADAQTLAICRLVRHDPEINRIPIIVIGAPAGASDVIRVLRSGADLYSTVDDDPTLLLARIKTILRRCSWAEAEGDVDFDRQDRVLRVGDIMIRPARFSVHVKGQPVDLTVSEFRILMLLASRPGRVFTREQVFASLHQHDADASDRSLDSHIYTLRRKVGGAAACIQTVRGMGYRLVNRSDPEST